MEVYLRYTAFTLLLHLGFLTNAMASYQQQVRDSVIASQLIDKGDSLRKLMRLDDAYTVYENAEARFVKLQDWSNAFTVRGHRARILIQQQKFEKARELCLLSLAESRKHLGPSHRTIASFYNLLAAVAGLYKSDYPTALKYHLAALRAVEGLQDPESKLVKARTLGSIGMSYRLLGDFEKAEEYISGEIELIKELKGDESLHLSFSYQDLGKIKSIQGDYQEAEKYYRKVLAIQQREFPPYHQFIAQSLIDLGNIYSQMGAYPDAVEYFSRAEDAYRRTLGYINPTVAYALRSKGNAYIRMGMYSRADTAFQKAMDILHQTLPPGHMDIADLHHLRSNLMKARQQYIAAINEETKALTFYRKNLGEEHIKVAASLQQLGVLMYKHKDLAGALKYLQQARNILENTFKGQGLKLAEIDYYLAQVRLSEGDVLNAFEITERALNELGVSVGKNPGYSSDPLIVDLLAFKARLYGQRYSLESNQADLEKSLAWYEKAIHYAQWQIPSLEENSRVYYLEHIYPVYEQAVEKAFRLFEITNNSDFFESALNFAEQNKSALLKLQMQQQRALIFAGIDDELVTAERTLRQRIVATEENLLELRSEAVRDSLSQACERIWSSRLLSLRQSYRVLIQKMEKDYPRYNALKHSIPQLQLSDIQSSLAPNEITIEYFYGDKYVYAFSIQRKGVKCYRQPSAKVNRLLMALHSSLLPTGSKEGEQRELFVSSATQLYKLLLRPALLPEDSGELLICLIPDGDLCFMPFEVLLTQKPISDKFKDMPFLLKKHIPYYAYSLSTLAHKGNAPLLSYLGIAPEYSLAVASTDRAAPGGLSYNRDEVEKGAALFAGQVLEGPRATIDNFLKLAPGAATLHLAMHARLDGGHPLQSGFYFTPDSVGREVLHLYELFNLDLNANLAILSSCNSGKGQHLRGEGIMSLARGFRYAGVNNVAMSLWSINDKVSADIVSSFLNGLKNGKSKPLALRDAKLEYLTRADNLRSTPYYWAPLVYIGENSPLQVERHSGNIGWYLLAGLGLLVVGVLFFVFKGR